MEDSVLTLLQTTVSVGKVIRIKAYLHLKQKYYGSSIVRKSPSTVDARLSISKQVC
jgi:hypothetical protein